MKCKKIQRGMENNYDNVGKRKTEKRRRERWIGRQTDRQTDIRIDKQSDREKPRHSHRDIRERGTGRQTYA